MANAANTRYVKPNAEGGWDVLKEGHRRTSVHAPTKGRALARARELARQDGGGEIRVLNGVGKVIDTARVAAPARARMRRAA